ncbi:MAG TPA: ferritin-like domain-containing protein [Solirubrobacteraceae bacterium]|nr:ferritin-like domain-containing protein [Solirubrobacteraceae bacterium]
MASGSTRRQVVVGALAAAGSAVGFAAVGTDTAIAADTPTVTDPEALSKALAVERLMVLAYRRVLTSGVLEPDIERALAPYLTHEIQHVTAVAGALKAIGVTATTTQLDHKTASDLLSKHNIPISLSDLHSQNDAMRLLVDLESVAEGVYFTALKTLSTQPLQRLAAQIMACEAQHWTAVSGLRNPGQYVKAVPWPFVTGSS